MKPSSLEKAPKGISRAKARNCMLLNLAGTPGLGSLVAGRLAEGIPQLLLALVGFALFTVWIVKIFIQYYGQISGNVQVQPVGWIGLTGGILFAIAWFWSLATGISVSREARDNEIAELKMKPLPPPKI